MAGATDLPTVWGLLHRQLGLISAGLNVAVENINARLEAEYGEVYVGLTDIIMGKHMVLAAAIAAIRMAQEPIAGRVMAQYDQPMIDIYNGVQSVHDALYHRLNAAVVTLGNTA